MLRESCKICSRCASYRGSRAGCADSPPAGERRQPHCDRKAASRMRPKRVVEFQREVGAFGEPPHRIDEGNALILLHEGEDIPAFMAPEAVENLTMRIDVEARTLLTVEGTEGNEVCPGSFQG